MRAFTVRLTLVAAAAAVVSGVMGEPGLAAAFATLAVVGSLDSTVRQPPPPVGASVRPAAQMAEEVVAAETLADIEAIIRHEIDRFDSLEVLWIAVTPLVPELRTDQRPGVQRELGRVLAAVTDPTRETRVPLAGGEAVALPCGARSGLVLVVATARPISTEVALELADLAVLVGFGSQQLSITSELDARRADTRFEELVRFSSDAIFITDAAGVLKYAAPSVTAVLGYRSGDLEGRSAIELLGDDQEAEVTRFFAEVERKQPRQTTTAELRVTRADGRAIDVDVVGANLLDNPDVRGIVVTMRDVSARRDLEAQLRHQAFHDPLTGLANRALFRDRLDRAMRVRRTGNDPLPAVVFLDLDDFKNVNDSLGHEAGDALLQTVADRISSCLRGADTAARLGGDEFALLLETLHDADAVVSMVQRVVDAVCVPLQLDNGTTIAVRTSAGIAVAMHESESADDLLRHADMAMYRAKLRGKAQVALYEPGMHHAALDRLALTAELDAAIDGGDVTVDFQPIVDLRTGTVVGVEALPRWVHPTRGVLARADLMPLAEETGLVVSLGLGVLRQGLAALAEWRRLSPQDVFLSVEASPRLLRSGEFFQTTVEELARNGLDPSVLVVDVSERVLGADLDGLDVALNRFIDHGVRLGVADVGTGAVSMRHLREIAFSQVKIGPELVASMSHPRGRAIVEAMVSLAHSIHADTVAVGIDDPADVEALRAVGCRFGQGRHLAPPSGERTVGFLLQQPLEL